MKLVTPNCDDTVTLVEEAYHQILEELVCFSFPSVLNYAQCEGTYHDVTNYAVTDEEEEKTTITCTFYVQRICIMYLHITYIYFLVKVGFCTLFS
jgi:hypothetical protein